MAGKVCFLDPVKLYNSIPSPQTARRVACECHGHRDVHTYGHLRLTGKHLLGWSTDLSVSCSSPASSPVQTLHWCPPPLSECPGHGADHEWPPEALGHRLGSTRRQWDFQKVMPGGRSVGHGARTLKETAQLQPRPILLLSFLPGREVSERFCSTICSMRGPKARGPSDQGVCESLPG